MIWLRIVVDAWCSLLSISSTLLLLCSICDVATLCSTLLSFYPCSMFFVWHYCSPYPCSMLLFLLSLLDATILRSLLNVVVLLLLSQCCYFSCPYSTLLFLHSLFNPIVVVCLFNVGPPFSLLDTVPFVLFVRLYYSCVLARQYCSSLLAQHCSSCAPCSMLWFLHSLFVFNIACSHSSTSLLHHDVTTLLFFFFVQCWCFSTPCSLFNVVVLAFLVSNWYFPLVFLQVWEELFKFYFFRPNLEGESLFGVCKNYLDIVHLFSFNCL